MTGRLTFGSRREASEKNLSTRASRAEPRRSSRSVTAGGGAQTAAGTAAEHATTGRDAPKGVRGGRSGTKKKHWRWQHGGQGGREEWRKGGKTTPRWDAAAGCRARRHTPACAVRMKKDPPELAKKTDDDIANKQQPGGLRRLPPSKRLGPSVKIGDCCWYWGLRLGFFLGYGPLYSIFPH